VDFWQILSAAAILGCFATVAVLSFIKSLDMMKNGDK
jgi:hypothetical protein